MAFVNENFLGLSSGYLFADIARRVKTFRATHPETNVISLGIGDVTQPLCPAVIQAMHKAVDEMASSSSFRGYGPEQGYDFLREAIAQHDFQERGIPMDTEEIFVNDGAKSDTGNIQELLGQDCVIGVSDPVYPVYIDSNVMAGRAGTKAQDGRWSNILYMPCSVENGFVPSAPQGQHIDVVYLCFPNNPTGAVIGREDLERWVQFALENDVLILYDAAYHAYIRDAEIPMHDVAPSSSIPTPRQQDSRECVVAIRLFPRK